MRRRALLAGFGAAFAEVMPKDYCRALFELQAESEAARAAAAE